MNSLFVGRQEELQILAKLLKKRAASLVTVQGRRRIGKSRLIQEFAKDYTFYQFSGVLPQNSTTAQMQRDFFANQLKQQTGLESPKTDDWSDLFLTLAGKTQSGRIIVLFDEISWMGSKDPDFLGKLKVVWDQNFKTNPELMLVLCGSASAWIETNILSSTGFLGRVSLRLMLEELSLAECNQFWSSASGHVSAYEKLKILSVTGGVPRYLEEIQVSASAEENIKDLCFLKTGPLFNEFEDIFSDLFSKKSKTYKKIVQALSNGPLETKEIANKLEVEATGFVGEYLDDLVKSGFISRDYTWHVSSGGFSKLSHFRLSDNYVRFYLKYIDKNRPRIENGDFVFKSLAALPGWESMMGFQFENLVIKNRKYIRKALNIKPEEVVSDNPFFQRKTARQLGCQIDYLVQTKFGGLFVCEIKFSKYPVMPTVIAEVQQKLDRLVYPKGFSCRPVLIHVNGVHEDVIDSGFFAEIIDFGGFFDF